MSLEKFIKNEPRFGQLTASGKIDYFSYYLLKKDNFDGIIAKDINKCFEKLDLAPYSNVPNYLTKYSQNGKNQKYLKRKGKYFLENSTLIKIEQEIKKVEDNIEQLNGYVHTNNDLAGIQYLGEAGVTEECKDAVLKLLQFGDKIHEVKLLTYSTQHSLLLTINNGDLVAIKSGFTSGYYGEGPHGLSFILQILESHDAEMRECEVDENLFNRLDNSALTIADLEALRKPSNNKNVKWNEYLLEDLQGVDEKLWQNFPPVVPYAIIDHRIIDLALSFWENPDEKLLTGYRRLEDIFRKRSGINEHGSKLFSKAFQKEINWIGLNESEIAGRMQLFVGAYMAYRNPRAHQEQEHNSNDQLREFLLLNHLYKLESETFEIGKT